jgi:hypothetical protein
MTPSEYRDLDGETKMTRPNIIIIESGYATIVVPGGRQIVTTRLHTDRYVKIDDGRQYPQLCKGAARTGNTLTYHNDDQLARDCNARLFKTRKGFDVAAAKLAADEDYMILA